MHLINFVKNYFQKLRIRPAMEEIKKDGMVGVKQVRIEVTKEISNREEENLSKLIEQLQHVKEEIEEDERKGVRQSYQFEFSRDDAQEGSNYQPSILESVEGVKQQTEGVIGMFEEQDSKNQREATVLQDLNEKLEKELQSTEVELKLQGEKMIEVQEKLSVAEQKLAQSVKLRKMEKQNMEAIKILVEYYQPLGASLEGNSMLERKLESTRRRIHDAYEEKDLKKIEKVFKKGTFEEEQVNGIGREIRNWKKRKKKKDRNYH